MSYHLMPSNEFREQDDDNCIASGSGVSIQVPLIDSHNKQSMPITASHRKTWASYSSSSSLSSSSSSSSAASFGLNDVSIIRRSSMKIIKTYWGRASAVILVAVALAAIYLLDAESLSTKFKATSLRTVLKEDQCPKVIRDAVGVYDSNDPRRAGFENVLLLVSANYGNLDFLLNWDYLVRKHGLKYGIVAMDNKLYDYLGPDRAIKSEHEMDSGASSFRKKAFNEISCNKMQVVLNVMEKCNVDVVFSDVDNVFLEDPFERDLGRLIKMQAYDYIYSPNERSLAPRSHSCLSAGEQPDEANTGFYYLSRKSAVIKNITEKTLTTCASPRNTLDDQTLFWNGVREHRGAHPNSWRHCSSDNGYDTPPELAPMEDSENTVDICCLDPYYYQIGETTIGKRKIPRNEDLISFHANFAIGKKGKMKKLMKIRGGWNPAAIEDSLLQAPQNIDGQPDSQSNDGEPEVVPEILDEQKLDILDKQHLDLASDDLHKQQQSPSEGFLASMVHSIQEKLGTRSNDPSCDDVLLFMPDMFTTISSQMNSYIRAAMIATFMNKALVVLDLPEEWVCKKDADKYPAGLSNIIKSPEWLTRNCPVPCQATHGFAEWNRIQLESQPNDMFEPIQQVCKNDNGRRSQVFTIGGNMANMYFENHFKEQMSQLPSQYAQEWASRLGAEPQEAEVFGQLKDEAMWDYLAALMVRSDIIQFQDKIIADADWFVKGDMKWLWSRDRAWRTPGGTNQEKRLSIYVDRGDDLLADTEAKVFIANYWESKGEVPKTFIPLEHYLRHLNEECSTSVYELFIATNDPIALNEEVAAMNLIEAPEHVQRSSRRKGDAYVHFIGCHRFKIYTSDASRKTVKTNTCAERYANTIASIVDFIMLKNSGTYVGEFMSDWGRLVRMFRLAMNPRTLNNSGESPVLIKDTKVAWGSNHPGAPGW